MSAAETTWVAKVFGPTSWRSLSLKLQSSSTGLIAVAVVIGAGSAVLATIFRWLISTFTRLFTGYADYAAVPGAANPHVPWLGKYFVVFTPVIAGMIYGPLVYRFAREARGHGVPEVMYAVAKQGGRIPAPVVAVKALASALTIGGGGSVGREGPIVQIASAFGSNVGRVLRASESRMPVFVACGAAGGIAATFNAPLAGVFFALELILMDFTTTSFSLVVVSSVVSAAIGRAIFGDESFLTLPTFAVEHAQEYLFFGVLGLVAGVVAIFWMRALYAIEDACDAVWRGPEWARPIVGGFLVGGVLLVLPQMYGVGYPVLGNAIDGRYTVAFMLILLLGKVVATSLTIGVGGSGGVFAPSLFIGAMLGASFGTLLHAWVPGASGSIGAYGLIGMGAVFAGTSRAPMTAVLILFELTGEYSIILPLMLAVVLATVVSRWMSRDTIYTMKLRRRGEELPSMEAPHGPLTTPVDSVMRPVPRSVSTTDPIEDAIGRLTRAAYGVLPVRDEHKRYVGVLTARAAAEAVANGLPLTSDAALLTELPAQVRLGDTLDQAIRALDLAGLGGIPVLGPDHEPIGWLTYRDLLARR